MGKQILTLDNLYQFFVNQNKSFNFSVKDSGKPIVVSMPGNFEVADNDMQGMLKTKIKVCHIDTNRNGSHISEENMKKAMPSIKYRPLLAHIHQLEDGTWDFYAHNMEIVEDENGEEYINYIEKQVGCYTADEPYLEYDKDMDKTYVYAYGVIPEDYTMAADIIRRKKGTKVSCELVINELSYNAKEKYLDLTDFYFGGTTLLGCDEKGNEIGEGMLGARLDISDFCHKEPIFNYQDKLIEALEKLNYTLENFNKDTAQKGGNDMNKFEELLTQYGKTAEDVTFEIDGLSDDELDAKFKEVFGESYEESDEQTTDDQEDTTVNTDEDEDATDDESSSDSDSGEFSNRGRCSIDENGLMSITFEISHEDVRYGLYQLLSQYNELDNDWYFITNVYDDYFIFENWDGNKYYKQNYTVDGDNVAFEGERVELFKMMLTESEKIVIDEMRGNYSALVQYKADTEASQLKAQKDSIFAKPEYAGIVETKSFKKLVEDSVNYTVEECEQKANDILEDFNSFATNFSAKDNTNKAKTLGFNFEAKESKKKKAYGNLFDN